MAVFAVIGALDKIFGNRLKLGDEFEKGITTLGPLSLSMLGMMTIAPALADLLLPVITPVANLFGFDPSALAGILIANDMGGASLAVQIAADEKIGMFNALVVSAMMGCTISFTIPYGLTLVDKSQHREMLLGLLCGLVVSAMALLACAGARMALELLGGNRALFLMLRLLLLETALTLPALAVVLPLYRTVHRRCAADY